MKTTTHRNQSKSFSDIWIGEEAKFTITIDRESHKAFSRLFRDHSPIHCDHQFSSKTKFKRKIAYGFMLTGFLSRLYGEYLPGGSSICIRQESNFTQPVFIGDTIEIIGKVTNKIDATRCVEIETEMFREKTRVFRGSGLVQII